MFDKMGATGPRMIALPGKAKRYAPAYCGIFQTKAIFN
jgi:hypothetical protein